ncbi:hypothetical protein PVAG01_00498 [Phlyctema vagabunda]|uniref:Uncharacterized protein n=1 Tax=Phlyctema vagabunda TaxID=108571 RepID=A0ABR4PUE6_9HELO
MATSSTSEQPRTIYNTPLGCSQPPFSKDVGQLPYPSVQCEEVLSQLSVKRLEIIREHLWAAGRPQADSSRKSSLHRLKSTGLKFIIYEQADLHLLWGSGMIYVKPLPRCLLNFGFWQENLCATAAKSSSDQPEDIINGAIGLLFSYTWLIKWESDLHIAHEEGLISKEVDYNTWMAIRSSFLATFERDKLRLPWLAWRYDFAELRLDRVNLIWRLRPRTPYDITSLIRGYQNPYRVYTSFFEQNFSIFIVIFVYITVVLSAMQVGLSTTELAEDSSFQQACLGFAVFCILLPVVVLVAAILLLIVLILFNWWITRRHLKSVSSGRLDHG